MASMGSQSVPHWNSLLVAWGATALGGVREQASHVLGLSVREVSGLARLISEVGHISEWDIHCMVMMGIKTAAS